jgi:hypothetical protein
LQNVVLILEYTNKHINKYKELFSIEIREESELYIPTRRYYVLPNGMFHGLYETYGNYCGLGPTKMYYKDGKLDGLYYQYYPTGELLERSYYKNGVRQGFYQKFYRNGFVMKQCTYNGKGKYHELYEEKHTILIDGDKNKEEFLMMMRDQ